jgi:hypothetical protein
MTHADLTGWRRLGRPADDKFRFEDDLVVLMGIAAGRTSLGCRQRVQAGIARCPQRDGP